MKTLMSSLMGLMLLGLLSAHGQQLCGNPASQDLIAGRNADAGDVVIANDDTFIYVIFMAEDGWTISETHVAVGNSVEELPQTRSGNPKVGRFPYAGTHNNETMVVYAIPRVSLNGRECYAIAAHAVVQNNDNRRVRRETAWGEGPGFAGRSWAMYMTYCAENCLPDA